MMLLRIQVLQTGVHVGVMGHADAVPQVKPWSRLRGLTI